ncbi:hypothetical protein [Clostridium sp. Ade.TY]|uniref:hypothetical protein n=1 Tax=Clostridium sp. Ade.TY TaxID=1391647 RepID=UPI0004658A14|nr:hypothetical protein [Clostridium sp. Ade.TY]
MSMQSKVISKLVKINVYKCERGKIIMEIKCLRKVNSKYNKYEKFLKMAITKLNGVTEVNLDSNNGFVIINYDENKQNKENVIDWAYKIREIGIENVDLIKNKGRDNLAYLVENLEKKLELEAKKYLLKK